MSELNPHLRVVRGSISPTIQDILTGISPLAGSTVVLRALHTETDEVVEWSMSHNNDNTVNRDWEAGDTDISEGCWSLQYRISRSGQGIEIWEVQDPLLIVAALPAPA